MPTLIIAATSEGAGKTAVTAAITKRLSSDQRPAFAAQAWAESNGFDRRSLHTLLGDHASAEPLGSDDDTPSVVARKASEMVNGRAVAVIEGKTGAHDRNLALAEATDGLVLLVAKPGDEVLSSASSYGSRLAGVIINAVPQYRRHDVESRIIPELKQANIRVLGWLPEDRRLLAPTIGLVADHLQAEFLLNEENSDRLIDNFLIGGFVLDWGPFYFGSKENVGVVVRGDRPDVQLAAVQTDTVKAMVLTKGARPVEYVVYEASQREIPVILTASSTEETAIQLETLLPRIRFDHPDKLARMMELADERLDLGVIEDALSQPVTR